MINRGCCILIALLHMMIFTDSQTVNYQCNFDLNLLGDCQFTPSSGAPNLGLDGGSGPVSAPRQPLSDASAVHSPTSPNNEYCRFPYPYPTTGGWPMHFCRRYSATNYTCPTPSGLGQCVIGKHGLIRTPPSGLVDSSYTADVQQSSSREQCLDFYYYITDTLENAKIQMGWKKDAGTQQIVEVAAVLAENKWQHSQTDFLVPPSASPYQITFRILRDRGVSNYFFALDEMKIYDQACDTIPTTTTPMPPTTIVDASTSTKILPDTTASESTTAKPILPDTTTLERTTTQAMATDTSVHTSTITTSTLTGVFLSTIPTQTIDLETSSRPSDSTMEMITSPSITSIITTAKIDTNANLALILPLAIGIPASLAFIGGLVYYFKIIRPKHKIMVNRNTATTEIPLAPTNNTTTIPALVV